MMIAGVMPDFTRYIRHTEKLLICTIRKCWMENDITRYAADFYA